MESTSCSHLSDNQEEETSDGNTENPGYNCIQNIKLKNLLPTVENKTSSVVKIAPRLLTKNMHVKLLKIITQTKIGLSFHIQLQDSVYFYTFQGIKSNFEIVLKCNKCAHLAYLWPSDFLKELIFDRPKGSTIIYSKDMKLSNPGVCDPSNYRFRDISEYYYHKRCLAIKLNVYMQKYMRSTTTFYKKPKNGIHCFQIGKTLKIVKTPRGPLFHIEINKKVYFYAFKGIRLNFAIVLKCKKCSHLAYLRPHDILKNIIFDNPKTPLSKDMNFSDPRVYELESYDFESFNIDRIKNCLAIKLEDYMKPNSSGIDHTK
jgi:hypothetical protein